MDLHHELHPKSLDRYRDEAKALLRAHRAGDTARARAVLGDRERFVLADALHVIAREHGHRSWPAFKRATENVAGVRPVYRIGAFGHEEYEKWADRLLLAARAGDRDALHRLREHVPRLAQDPAGATEADARVCLAREYGFRTWDELAEATDRARDTHYSGLPADLPWKQGEAAIRAHDVEALRAVLEQHPGVEHEDPGMSLIVAAAQPEAGAVPREIVEALIEVGSDLDDALGIAACFNKPDMVGWLLDAGADPHLTESVSPLQTATYHGAREAFDVLVTRTGLVPDHFYLAAAAGDLDRMARWFDGDTLLAKDRPNLTDVGMPGRAIHDDPGDVLAEALAFAAQFGRTEACTFLLDRGAEVGRAPLYGVTPLHYAAYRRHRETAELLVARGAPIDALDGLNGDPPFVWAGRDPAWADLLSTPQP